MLLPYHLQIPDAVFHTLSLPDKPYMPQECRLFLQYRGSKDFSDRNVDICHTIFEISLLLWIIQFVQGNVHIGVIFSFSEHMYTLTLIQGIDQFLLDICIELIVKRIDADRLFKNLREVCPDFRNGRR